jgi:serine/threonine-protein kinase
MIENGSNVRLMDLGISRMNGGNKFSMYGFIGTPQYSAPEQIKREEGNTANPINATTDIYELGITFYELLTGENPMDASSDSETLAKQISEPLPSNPAIPKKLMNVIWKATEKEQSKRYQSALEFKNAINEALLPDPPLWERISIWMQNHIVALVSIIVAVAVIIFFIILIII